MKKKVKVRNLAPSFILVENKRKPQRLSEFRSRKVVLTFYTPPSHSYAYVVRNHWVLESLAIKSNYEEINESLETLYIVARNRILSDMDVH